MRTLFFCARDIRDYLKGIIDTSELNKTPNFDPRFPALNDAPAVQNFLMDIMKVYSHREEGYNGTVCGETGIDGLRLDFNFGLRIEVPAGNFHVTIGDADSGIIFFDRDISDVKLISLEKYFIRWRVDVSLDGEKIFSHTFNPEGQTILAVFDKVGSLGDILAMFPYAQEFAKIFSCRVLMIDLPEHLRELAAYLYPELEQIENIPPEIYATYYLSMKFGDLPLISVDTRNTPIELMSKNILGINHLPPKPTFKPTEPRIIPEPYVCIAVQASGSRKCWLWPGGWDIIVDYLKRLGYRVFCIDKNAQVISDGFTICRPEGAEDFTGDLPLMQRANMLYHAEFFVGLSSGLAWIADMVNCPVVMIGGFTQDWHEFYTPYRVANRLVCNGCFNDLRVFFTYKLCPYHNSTDRELECQKKISPQQVINAIDRLLSDKRR